MNSIVGLKIRSRRKELGMTQKELADKLGYTNKSTIGKIESGINDITQSKVVAFAEALQTTPAYLMGWEDDQDTAPGLQIVSAEDLPNVLPIYKHAIPIYPAIACGTPIEANEHADYYAVSKEPIKASFAVIAKGDSMIDARINDGDVVFIEKCDMVDNGDIAAVLIDGAATLKRFYYNAEKQILTLVSENKKYEPMVYTGSDALDVRVLGRAVCAQIYF